MLRDDVLVGLVVKVPLLDTRIEGLTLVDDVAVLLCFGDTEDVEDEVCVLLTVVVLL